MTCLRTVVLYENPRVITEEEFLFVENHARDKKCCAWFSMVFAMGMEYGGHFYVQHFGYYFKVKINQSETNRLEAIGRIFP